MTLCAVTILNNENLEAAYMPINFLATENGVAMKKDEGSSLYYHGKLAKTYLGRKKYVLEQYII